MADGGNDGRRPRREQGTGPDEGDPTRALPRPGPERPRAWSQVPGRSPPPPGRPPSPPPSRPAPPPPRTQQWDRAGVDRTEYAPRQTPQPYREPPSYGRTRPDAYGPPPGSGPARATRPRRRPRWGRRLAVLLLVLVLAVGGLTLYVDSTLNRTDALADWDGRPAATAGTNWLLVGSDSREGLSQEEKDALATGDSAGSRTDTIMLVHVADNGASTLVSIPRDSYLEIPGTGLGKVNAAFSIGGPQLLARTVEQASGLRVDHYAEVGFSGFAGAVDAVGGVEVCLEQAITDPAAGIDLAAGCQELGGADALGFVRSRATFANQDLTRIDNQRAVLSALLAEATSPSTLVNPLRMLPLATSGIGALTVDSGDHVWNLLGLARAVGSGDLVNTTVPIAGTPTVDGAGSVVEWDDDAAQRLFGALAADQPVPPELLPPG